MNKFHNSYFIFFCRTANYPQFLVWVCGFARVCCFMYSMKYVLKETKLFDRRPLRITGCL